MLQLAKQTQAQAKHKKMTINCTYNSTSTPDGTTGLANCTTTPATDDILAINGFSYGDILTNFFIFLIMVALVFGFILNKTINKK